MVHQGFGGRTGGGSFGRSGKHGGRSGAFLSGSVSMSPPMISLSCSMHLCYALRTDPTRLGCLSCFGNALFELHTCRSICHDNQRHVGCQGQVCRWFEFVAGVGRMPNC